MFADIHSHVLCGIDDGARDVKETQRLLGQLREGGVTHLAFTPHYYPYKESLDSFLSRREKAYEAVMALPEAEHFTVAKGAEVYLSGEILNYDDLSPLCYAGTRYMLTELEYTEYYTDAMQYRLLRLVEDYNVVPVLAHINRYPFLWKDPKRLEKLKRMGCRFQVNISSLGGFFSCRQAMKLYASGYLDFLGEDVHHNVLTLEERNELLLRASKKYKDFADRVTREAVSRLFSGS